MVNNNNMQEPTNEPWKGVTLEELKFMRAKALIRLEMQKEYVKHRSVGLVPFIGGGSSNGVKTSFAQKILLFVKGVKMAGNLFSLFKRK